MTTGVTALAGLFAATVSLILNWRERHMRRRSSELLERELHGSREECLRRIGIVGENLQTLEESAQSSLELLRDGRLGLPSRARALRLIRSGMSPDSAAKELGLARTEMQLLAKVAGLLSPGN